MTVSTTRLNDLYWRSFIKKYQDDKYGEDAAHHTPPCDASMDGNENEVSAMGLRGGIYVFRRNVLEAESVALLSALKRVPKGIRQSVSPDGIPWIMVRSAKDSILSGSDDETVERFLLMCMALGFVQQVPCKCSSCYIPYVTMPDGKLVRMEKMKEGKKRAILTRWFR